LRDRLIGEVAALTGADGAAAWVHRTLPLKNTLTIADAQCLEMSFKERLSQLGAGAPHEIEPAASCTSDVESGEDAATQAGEQMTLAEPPPNAISCDNEIASPVEATTTTVVPPRRRRLASKTIRLRDKEHCKFVARQPCLVCGRTPSEAHHVRFAQPRALGRKVSDEFTVPVCRLHHRELHRYGDEASWWAGVAVDPVALALALWSRSHPNPADFSAESATLSAETPGR
jgi:hypothetical protein